MPDSDETMPVVSGRRAATVLRVSGMRALATRFVDMFAFPLRHSHYVELVRPLWVNHHLQARVEEVIDETRDTRTLVLRPGRGWRRHRAGQHVRVGVQLGGMRHTRTYSIASAPEREDGCITITVKAVAGGRVSTHLARRLAPGALLPIGVPQGDFVLPDAVPVRPLFVTAGSGVTPIMSMLRSMAARFERLPDVVHLHYAPHAQDTIFGDELNALAAGNPRYRYVPTYTRDLGRATTQERHFHVRALDGACPDWRQRDVWACGPAGLLRSLEEELQPAGFRGALHVERFAAKLAPLSPDAAAGGRVRFARSGVTAQSDGRQTLLRVAEDAGLDPAHGCRMGICHGCDVRLVAGCVRDLRTGATFGEPGETIQPCVSAAIGDVDVDL